MRLSAYLFIAMLVTVWLAAPAPLRAEEARYEDVIQRALQEFDLDHWSEAKVLFVQAYTLRPNARALRGLGLTCYELRQYVEAIVHFEASLRNSVQPLSQDMANDVRTFLARSREFIGRLAIETQPATVEILIDGNAAARSAEDGTFPLDPGQHDIAISAGGFEPHSRSIFVESGKTTRLTAILRPLRAEVAETVAPSAPVDRALKSAPAPVRQTQEPSQVGPWVVIGVSSAVAVAGGVMLGVAAREKHRVENPDGGARWSDYTNSYDTGNTLFPVGAVMLGVGLTGAAVGVGWRIFNRPESSEPSATLDLTPGGVGISGRL